MGWRYFTINEAFIKIYKEHGEVGYILEVDVKYLEKLYKLHEDVPFLPDRKKKLKSRKPCN